MNRSRMFILAGVAFAVALAVTLFTYRALRDRLQPSMTNTTQIVVAAQGVSIGSRLQEADLRLAPWPRAVPLEGSFQRISDVVGRGAVVPMVLNEPILESKLAASGAGGGLMATIPDGMRAVSVKVNDVIGVAGFVVPGSRVDVILCGSPARSNDVDMSKVILENVQVLAAGQNVTNDANGKPQSVQVVTMLVTPNDSEKLALASVDGRIQLSLRNPLDLERMNPNAVRRESLYGASSGTPEKTPAPSPVAPKPAAPRVAAPKPEPPVPVAQVTPPPAPPAPVIVVPPKLQLQVIQGTKTETVTFEKKADAPGGNN
jgi:pilus assembly protein CpaB